MLQKTILRDKAVVDVFKAMLGAVNPVQGIVGRYSFRKSCHLQGAFYSLRKIYLFLSATANASKVYASAVAKTQKIWGSYLEAIMKVPRHDILLYCEVNY